MKANKMKLGTQTGSLFNHLMSNNESVPVVGKGATVLYWTDRHAYEVLEVNEEKKTCVIQRYDPKRTDNLGMSDSQDYEYKELTGPKITLYYKWGAWRSKSRQITFTDEVRKEFADNSSKLHEAYKYAGGEYIDALIVTVIPGLTKEHYEYDKVNIIFGVKKEYYDFSF